MTRDIHTHITDIMLREVADAIERVLAEALDIQLLTDDENFAAALGHSADIHVYPD